MNVYVCSSNEANGVPFFVFNSIFLTGALMCVRVLHTQYIMIWRKQDSLSFYEAPNIIIIPSRFNTVELNEKKNTKCNNERNFHNVCMFAWICNAVSLRCWWISHFTFFSLPILIKRGLRVRTFHFNSPHHGKVHRNFFKNFNIEPTTPKFLFNNPPLNVQQIISIDDIGQTSTKSKHKKTHVKEGGRGKERAYKTNLLYIIKNIKVNQFGRFLQFFFFFAFVLQECEHLHANFFLHIIYSLIFNTNHNIINNLKSLKTAWIISYSWQWTLKSVGRSVGQCGMIFKYFYMPYSCRKRSLNLKVTKKKCRSTEEA